MAHAATCPVRFAVSVAGCGWFGGNDIDATLKTCHSWGRGVAGLLGSSGFGLLSAFRPAFAWSCSPVILLWTNKGCQCTFISINKPNFTAGLSDGIFVSLLRQLRLLSSGPPTLPSERVEHDHAQLCYQLPFAAVPYDNARLGLFPFRYSSVCCSGGVHSFRLLHGSWWTKLALTKALQLEYSSAVHAVQL